jgi:polyisoprenoid-binding protein YceI
MASKWLADPAHTEIQFKIRHLMITNVTGSFGKFDAEVEETTDNSFETAKYPTLSFVSTKVEKISGEEYNVSGDLTMHGITKNIKLHAEHGGVIKDPWGNTRTGFTVEGKINRKDFGLIWNGPTESGGVVLSDEVKIHASLEFVKQA